MRNWIALVLGAAIAAIVACGGASKSMKTSGMAPPPTAAGPDMATSPRANEIAELDKKIDDAFAQLAIPRPTPTASSDMNPMVTPLVKPTTAPTCKPGPSKACTDTCKLADSICENAGKICEIAAELGDDAYAKGKCGSGRASCDAAGERCCGCL